jgi:hypothetical protein
MLERIETLLKIKEVLHLKQLFPGYHISGLSKGHHQKVIQ